MGDNFKIYKGADMKYCGSYFKCSWKVRVKDSKRKKSVKKVG